VIIGSHCMGLDLVTGALVAQGLSVRTIAVGSMGGLQALARGECDLAPIHLLDLGTGRFNAPFLTEGQLLIPGWRRMQGIVHRQVDARFQGKDSPATLADPDCLMIGRDQGAGARILINPLLAGRRSAGCWNQPQSHTAIATAVAQGRADWGLTIAPVAAANGLGFIPVAEEHYDFSLTAAHIALRLQRCAWRAFSPQPEGSVLGRQGPGQSLHQRLGGFACEGHVHLQIGPAGEGHTDLGAARHRLHRIDSLNDMQCGFPVHLRIMHEMSGA